MNDKKNLFDINPPEGHAARMENAVADLLKQKRSEEKRKLLAWILVPTFASIMGFFIWRRQPMQNEKLLAHHDFLLEVEDEADLEILAEMDLLEELEDLEDLNGSEET